MNLFFYHHPTYIAIQKIQIYVENLLLLL